AMLGAVMFERQALSMRNLAMAALATIALEPEALLGASFQLSFAAVAALVAVFEGRSAARAREKEARFAAPLTQVAAPPSRAKVIWRAVEDKLRHGLG